MAPPPTPYFNTTHWYMCPNQSRSFWITNPSTISSLYTHRWDISGPNGYFNSVYSDNLTLSYLSPGSYTITLIRSYSGGAVSNISTLNSRVFTVYPSSHSECGGGGGGPIQRIIPSEDLKVGAGDTVGTNDRSQKLDIRLWPNPADSILHVSFEMKE
jgi:hypothetical protein